MKRNKFYDAVRYFLRFVMTVFFDLRGHGIEHVPRTGGVLIIANHQSFLDPILITLLVRRQMSFLAKAALWNNRIFGWIITRLNAFPIRQGEGDVGAVRETIKRLQEGHLLAVFPEGSRSEDGDLQEIAGGIAVIVRRAKVPVVPCIIDGAFDAWPRHRKYPRLAPLDLQYGPVMDLCELKGDEIVRQIDTVFKQMMGEVRSRRQAEHRGNHAPK